VAGHYPALVDVEVSRDDDMSVIAVCGELDLSTVADLLDAALNALSEASCHRLTIDMSGVRFIDSSGINALIEIRNATLPAHTALSLARVSPRVAEVLRLTAVDHLFDVTEA
jgi:anti-anti-sigma factor